MLAGFFSAQEEKHLHFVINEADFPVSYSLNSLQWALIFCICQTAHFNGTSSFLWAPTSWSVNSDLPYPQDQWELALLFNFPLKKKKKAGYRDLSVCHTAVKGLMLFSFWTVGESLCSSSGLCAADEVWEWSSSWQLVTRTGLFPHLWNEGRSPELILLWDCDPNASRERGMCPGCACYRAGLQPQVNGLVFPKRTVSLEIRC